MGPWTKKEWYGYMTRGKHSVGMMWGGLDVGLVEHETLRELTRVIP
jgi:hypothetical protein